MTSRPPAPPLPKPQHPAVAAKALAEAAYAAAHAWAQPLEPDSHNRAISQLYSTLRDLGIAARGLARYQTAGASPDPASRDFPRHVTASARWLLSACESLDGVLAAEGTQLAARPGRTRRGPVPGSPQRDPGLEAAIRNQRRPRHHRQAVHHSHRVPLLRHAGPCDYAPRRRAIDLQVVGASLAEVIAYLTAAIQVPAEDAAPGYVRGPAGYQGGGE